MCVFCCAFFVCVHVSLCICVLVCLCGSGNLRVCVCVTDVFMPVCMGGMCGLLLVEHVCSYAWVFWVDVYVFVVELACVC